MTVFLGESLFLEGDLLILVGEVDVLFGLLLLFPEVFKVNFFLAISESNTNLAVCLYS
jgi:hypothetical protein